jgi:hypothetical protein
VRSDQAGVPRDLEDLHRPVGPVQLLVDDEILPSRAAANERAEPRDQPEAG